MSTAPSASTRTSAGAWTPIFRSATTFALFNSRRLARRRRSSSVKASPRPRRARTRDGCFWPSTTSRRRELTWSLAAWTSARSSMDRGVTTPARRVASPAQTRSIKRTRHLPPSLIRMAMNGACRKLQSGCQAANGGPRQWTSLPSPTCCTKRRSTTTRTKSRTPPTTGGTGTPRICTRAKMVARARRRRPPRHVTWSHCYMRRQDDTASPGNLIGELVVGALAGAVGTAAMDLLLYRRYQRGGGQESLWQWEFAGDVTTWDRASAPGQLGHKLLRLALR